MDRVEKRKTTTILIVDDSELNRVMLAAMLGENYEILEASDGVEALSVIQKYETSIDLVLLDIVMPGMDGFEVLKVMNQKHWIDTKMIPPIWKKRMNLVQQIILNDLMRVILFIAELPIL